MKSIVIKKNSNYVSTIYSVLVSLDTSK